VEGDAMSDARTDGTSPSASKDRYRELFERSADAILIIDGDTFIDCNEATVRMLRYRNRAELLQTHPSELSPEFQPDGRPSFEKANEMITLAFEQGSHRFEWDHVRADGEVFPVEVLLTAVPEGSRSILHVVWRDITDRKQLEAELRHAQKMEAIGKLAGGVSHDFNNLLVVIIGHATLMHDALDELPELQEQASSILGAAERAAELTSQLLAFSRKQVLKLEVLDLATAVTDQESMLRRLIGEDIRLSYERPSEPCFVKADPGQIEQVVFNLVANSRDAMPGGGTLSLSLSRLSADAADGLRVGQGEQVSLRISDTGAGMSEETLARAFEPFFTTKERGRGTGLGLASVYGIVKQSGGEVRISSRLGEGTTVEVVLPCTDERPGVSVNQADHQAEDGVRSGRVLLVEDEPMVAQLACRILRSDGYEVVQARNGGEALDLANSADKAFDLVITDVIMPVMSGPELVRFLRRGRPEQGVLFMSGYPDDALVRQGFDIGEVELLRKPFTPSALRRRVAEVLAGGGT
jgi:PAS domain S-box-containing protein